MSAYAMPGSLAFPTTSFGGSSCGVSTRTTTATTFGSSITCNHDRHQDLVVAESCREQQVVGIAVKDARLDPVALTTSLTKRTSLSPKERRRTRGTPTTTSSCSALPSLPIPAAPSKNNKNVTSSSAEDEKHGEAIQLDLSIKLYGQKYSATRTLSSVLQLRRDLIREVNKTKTNLVGSTNSIPHVPRYWEEECSKTTFGFSGMQALLQKYCPILEGWFATVVHVVGGGSETLENFLWEPTKSNRSSTCSSQQTATLLFDPVLRTTGGTTTTPTLLNQGSTTSLQSIKEDDNDDEEEEEEEKRHANRTSHHNTSVGCR
eukprot:CAMPEP_0194042404 /NCGR_PEP_ID=MMETSP0009_2-20130614/14182_1 /TAXON_ID=210454 /ORGANISM="Grammatophora oceanica, Strain CCMP 410" /LENGTH=317 /DNA_ID=CAMNT_0038686239 /DNA_START=223 /DNA_END=1176 /DNA_ORIENTATION=+